MIRFLKMEPSEIEHSFQEFYDNNKDFFEIINGDVPIGFYGIKRISDKVCEISVYINENRRREITKKVAISCLKFPFSEGFKKILISTKLKNMERFLRKMSKIGVKYLFKNQDFHWFEVNYEF